MSPLNGARGADPLPSANPSNAAALTFELPESLLERLAERVAQLVLAQLDVSGYSSPWLDVNEAAEYLRCKPKRVYDLVGQSRLPVHRDGSRLLFDRAELDAYLADTALTPPADGPQNRRARGGARIETPRVGGRSCR